VLAQSPNTAAIVVVVLDQTGAIVAGANVTTTNTATGAIREVISGADGSATISGLSLTGTYAIRVNKSGFSAEGIADLALRAGETATSGRCRKCPCCPTRSRPSSDGLPDPR